MYLNLINFISGNSLTIQENYEYVKSKIDIDKGYTSLQINYKPSDENDNDTFKEVFTKKLSTIKDNTSFFKASFRKAGIGHCSDMAFSNYYLHDITTILEN